MGTSEQTNKVLWLLKQIGTSEQTEIVLWLCGI